MEHSEVFTLPTEDGELWQLSIYIEADKIPVAACQDVLAAFIMDKRIQDIDPSVLNITVKQVTSPSLCTPYKPALNINLKGN